MKTSIYINSENEKRLKAMEGGATVSSVVNKALELYFTDSNTFDYEKLRNNGGELIKVCVPPVVAKVLRMLRDNFSVWAVCEFISILVLEEVDRQTGRKKYPDRFYKGADYLRRIIPRVREKIENTEKTSS